MDLTPEFFARRRAGTPGTPHDDLPPAPPPGSHRGEPAADDPACGDQPRPAGALDQHAVVTALTQVRSVAESIGLRFEIDADGELLRDCLTLPGGREQQVFVRVSGRLAGGEHVLTLFSPCHRVPRGTTLAPETMRWLLLANERHRFVRVALWPMDDGELVVASWDQILETMEAEELGTQVRALAVVADQLEQRLGDHDRF